MSNEIDRARRVVGEATPGPWETDGCGCCVIRSDDGLVATTDRDADALSKQDAAAIRLMRNTYEPLLEVAEAADAVRYLCERAASSPSVCEWQSERDGSRDAGMCDFCRIDEALKRALTALREALPEEGGDDGE